VSRVRLAFAAGTSLLACLLCAATATAYVGAAETIDGPGAGILDVGGVAMAPDGSGGVVYRKVEDGRPHVFAARTVNGHWFPPQRLDPDNDFASSWPVIAAGNGGRLVATWVQEFGAGSDRLFSASLDPGATLFQPALVLDLNVGEATATFPSIAMSPGGTAYLAYRVVTATSTFPGYVEADVRVARYNGSLWSVLGPVDRNAAAPQRAPTRENSPRVGVDVTGNALVAWQEPDDDFIDRIWARRVFGSTLGIPLLVSPQSAGGAPLRAPADALALDETGFGEGAVAFRQQPAPGSGLNAARIFVNTIPEAFSDQAGAFEGARLVDGPGAAGAGAPQVGITPPGDFLATWGAGNASLATTGIAGVPGQPQRLDDGGSGISGEPSVEVADSGSAVLAWRARTDHVAVQERPLAGGSLTRNVNPADTGPAGPPLIAGSGLGDAITAFRSGDDQSARVEVAVTDAPPLQFEIQAPIPFVRSRTVRITWDPAPNAIGPVTYTVASRGQGLAGGLTSRSLRIPAAELGDGRHPVRVIATDRLDQETEGLSAVVRLDRTRPRVKIKTLRRHRVSVRVTDATSGPSARRTSISFGDGKKMRRKARAVHRYKRGGRFKIVVKTGDRVGNRLTVKRKVRVG